MKTISQMISAEVELIKKVKKHEATLAQVREHIAYAEYLDEDAGLKNPLLTEVLGQIEKLVRGNPHGFSATARDLAKGDDHANSR